MAFELRQLGVVAEVAGVAVAGVNTVSLDGQTREDQTVTIRHRDTLEQERCVIDRLRERLTELMESYQPPAAG